MSNFTNAMIVFSLLTLGVFTIINNSEIVALERKVADLIEVAEGHMEVMQGHSKLLEEYDALVGRMIKLHE